MEYNENDEFLTLRALKNNNWRNDVVVARDGEEALNYLFGSGKFTDQPQRRMPVLILLDTNLPKLDGIEVLRCIRNNEKAKVLPVVMLTSSNQEKDIIESYNLGANSYVVKPVDFSKFNEAVKQFDLYWLLLNQKQPLS